MSTNGLDKIVCDYFTISGMDISIVDSDFRSLSIKRGREGLCSLLHRDRGAVEKCKISDIEQLTYARDNLEPILYSCPFGITEAIVPIVRDNEAIGYIISTLGIRSCDDERIKMLCSKTSVKAEQIEKQVEVARKLTEEEIEAYLDLIRILAGYIANDPSLICESESIGRLIKKYIKDNLQRKLTLNELARNLHCSTVTLTEHFKREFGITINEYITKKRMELAEKVLLSTDKPLREIATLTGFADVEYFSRTFKKHHGISPASWRREKGEKQDDNTKNELL